MSKLTKLAEGRHCHFRLPCCRGGTEHTVFAHAPSITKAMSIKSEDWWGAPGCDLCHEVMDSNGKKHNVTLMPKELKEIWLRAIHEWQAQLFFEGSLRVESAP